VVISSQFTLTGSNNVVLLYFLKELLGQVVITIHRDNAFGLIVHNKISLHAILHADSLHRRFVKYIMLDSHSCYCL